MNYKKRLFELEQYVSERRRVYDTLGADFRAFEAEITVMKNPAPNWRVRQHAALSRYINARKSGKCSPEYYSWTRTDGLAAMKENRRYFRALGVFPVKHFCTTCRQVSRAPFLIGPLVGKASCRNDDCGSQWWNRPELGTGGVQ